MELNTLHEVTPKLLLFFSLSINLLFKSLIDSFNFSEFLFCSFEFEITSFNWLWALSFKLINSFIFSPFSKLSLFAISSSFDFKIKSLF